MLTLSRLFGGVAFTILALPFVEGAASAASASDLAPRLKPEHLVVDRSLPKASLEQQIDAALRYDTFWDNGEESFARAALSADFVDRTLPPGRPQGVEGPIVASRGFRAAVPDLRCAVAQMIVAGDRVVSHLHFTGHFTGTFNGRQGSGQVVDFIATDIYRVAGGRIVEDWHLEDNITFLKQIGAISP